ncbi:MAG: 50S ribosomal protein L11 methyltransferase [Bacillota bacterium]
MKGPRYLEVCVSCGLNEAEQTQHRLAQLLGVMPHQVILEVLPSGARVKAWVEGHRETRTLEAARALGELTARWVEEQEWTQYWSSLFVPTSLGKRFLIVPAWQEPPPEEGRLKVYIDPGRAFGTGTHPTTAMCVELLEDTVKPGDSLLDVGTGTGILAIVGARLGARRVWAVDIDGAAIEAARNNVARNGVAVELRLGSVEAAGDGPWQVVVANLGTQVAQEVLPEVAKRMEKGGWLVWSGTSCERKRELAHAMVESGFVPVRTVEREGWLAVLATAT